MTTKYLILIVIYNQKLDKSPSYQSILDSMEYFKKSKLIIWDNSQENQKINIDTINFFNQVEYIHTPENLSLSKIYNKVIQLNNGFDYMIILDQDSSFSKDYLLEIEKSINKNKDINLFLPIVKSNNTIVSPGDYKIFKGSYWRKEIYGKINSKNILAINSGMVINFNYFKHTFVGYDERLNFYGVDTYFMFEYAKQNEYCYVLDYTFYHESALLDEDEDINKKLFRLKDLFYSWKITNENHIFNLFFVNIYILFKVLKLAIKHKDNTYFKLLKD